MKTHWKKLTNPDYLGAYSLEEGKDLIVEIKSVSREMVKGADGKAQECTVAQLVDQKPFIINKTNAKTITKVINSPYIEDWSGQRIQLFSKSVRAFGDTVSALRVRSSKPKVPKLPELSPELKEDWAKCKEAIASGYTIDQIKIKWSLSPKNEKALCAK